MYCIEMGRSDEEFRHSRLSQIITMIDMYSDKQQAIKASMSNEHYESKYFSQKEEVQTIKSMKEIPGW